MLQFDRLGQTRDWARAEYEAHPAWVFLGFVAAYGVLTGLGVPVALALTLLAGAVFGALLGGAAIVVASTIAALLGHWLARSVLLGLMPGGVRKTPGVNRFARLVSKDPFFVVLSARLMPVLPFNAVNTAAGLASVPIWPYASATVLGGIPTSLIFTFLGSGLAETLNDRASLTAAVRSPAIWAPVLALALLSTTATLVRLRRK
ncbi:MAG: VTT domain-containing protein [Pseudomonadota bacterium]